MIPFLAHGLIHLNEDEQNFPHPSITSAKERLAVI